MASEKWMRPERWVHDRPLLNLHPRTDPLPAPEVGIFDHPRACGWLNLEWAAHVVGLVGWLLEDHVWEGDDDELYRVQNEIMAWMSQFQTPCLYCEDMSMLRQNPQDPCLLEQSLDGGNTWSLAFDYSRCLLDAQGVNVAVQLVINNYDEYQGKRETYEDTPTYVPPDLTYDASGDDDYRDAALCYAARKTVDMLCEIEIERREQATGQINLGAAIAAAIPAVLVLFAGIAIPPLSGAAIAVASAMFAAAATAFQLISDSVLSDENARNCVACCMYTRLKGTTPTRASLSTVLDTTCASCPSGNGEQLRGAIAPLLDTVDGQMAFLELWTTAFPAAQVGAIVTCGCEGWEYFIDLTAGLDIVELLGDTIYVPGFGIDNDDSGPPESDIMFFAIPFDPTHIIDVTLVFSDIPPRIHDGGAYVYSYDGGSVILKWERGFNPSVILLDQTLAGFRISYNPDPGYGVPMPYLQSIRITGTGANPFV